MTFTCTLATELYKTLADRTWYSMILECTRQLTGTAVLELTLHNFDNLARKNTYKRRSSSVTGHDFDVYTGY